MERMINSMSIIKDIKTDSINNSMIEENSFIINLIGYEHIRPDKLQENLYNICYGLSGHVKEVSNGDINKFGSYSLFEGKVFGKEVTVCNIFCKYNYLENKVFLKTYAISSALNKIYKDHDILNAYILYFGVDDLRKLFNQNFPVKTTLISPND